VQPGTIKTYSFLVVFLRALKKEQKNQWFIDAVPDFWYAATWIGEWL